MAGVDVAKVPQDPLQGWRGRVQHMAGWWGDPREGHLGVLKGCREGHTRAVRFTELCPEQPQSILCIYYPRILVCDVGAILWIRKLRFRR